MRILFTIPHYFKPEAGRHGSQRKHPKPRVQALSLSIAALHQLFSKSQVMIDVGQRVAHPANQIHADHIDVIICTTHGHHLLDLLALPEHFYRHHPTQAQPLFLGFECQAVLRDCLGQYDYYCFLEDDLILHDPWFFIKLDWFTQQTSPLSLLQPNRYEISVQTLLSKAYIDGNLSPDVTAPFQRVTEAPQVQAAFLGLALTFQRALNPHSGCYFLNQAQMEHWASQADFLDRSTRFIGPLESAATLGIMKTFRVYKPVAQQASFLEIQHFGRGFLGLIGSEIELAVPQ
ncbi:hypothetical protein [Trichothermofontia sp.]